MAGMIKLDDFLEQLAQSKDDSESPCIASALMQTAEKVMGTVTADFGVSKADAYYALKDFPATTEDKGKREVVSNITTIALDRDNEVVLPEGGIYDDYRDNSVVLWGHQYGQLGVGRNLWIVPDEDDMVHKARTRYTTQKSNPMGFQLYNYRKEGNPLAESIGFVPIEQVEKEDSEYDDVFESWLIRYTAFMQSMGRELPEKILPKRFFTKWVLLEYSDVMVPSNPFAVTVAVEKGLLTEEEVEKYTIKTIPEEETEEEAETILTAAGKTEGTWEAEEIEERDPIEAMRQSGLEKAADGIVPVTPELWNQIFDTLSVNEAKKKKKSYDPAFLQKVYGGIIPPDGKWNKGLSDVFDMPILEEVSATFRYSLYSQYLDCDIKDVYKISYDIPSPLLGTYLETISQATDDYKVHDIRNFSYDGKEMPPIRSQIQLKSDEWGEYLVNGTKFCTKDDAAKIILNFDACWGGVDFDIYMAADDQLIAKVEMSKIHALARENNMLKGEKFSLSGEFLPVSDEVWDDVVIPRSDKLAIANSLAVIEDGKSRGLLFAGPPGTGKTMSGRVIMNDTEATFIWVSTRDFGYRPSSSIISLAFNMARNLAPTILFMEDIDSWLGGGAIDAMKIEMDGLRKIEGTATILTTNHPEQLPEALVDRPGRFHHILMFDLPDFEQRHQMLKKWTDGISSEVVDTIAKETEGYSGAHIRHLVDYAEAIAEEESIDTGKALLSSMARLHEQRELISGFKGIEGLSGQIEVSDEDMDLMIQQQLKIREQQEQLQTLSHKFAMVNAKLTVLQGGTA